jgi:hypothetical protein
MARGQERANSNPFFHSGPVTGDRFHDRDEEMARLVGALSTMPPTSIALFGPPRIGKSSILRQLCEVVGPEKLDRCLIYLDMQGVFSVADFVRRFLRLAEAAEGSEEYAGMREAVEAARRPIVLCLDEFGKALSNPAFDADFYDFLRSLAQTGRLALVISTLRSLRELKVPADADVSRFFNIFRPLRLGPFPPDAARELVGTGLFKDEDVNWVVENVRHPNHPYHLQLLGACLFDGQRVEYSRKQVLQEYHEILAEIGEGGTLFGGKKGGRVLMGGDGSRNGGPATWLRRLRRLLEAGAGFALVVSVASALLMMVFLQPLFLWIMGAGFLVGMALLALRAILGVVDK